MPLTTVSLLLRSAASGRCLRCGVVSENDELYCDKCGPTRTTVSLTANHKTAIKDTVRVVRDARADIEQDERACYRIKRWLAGLISRGDESLEAVLHTYIYVFWSTLRFPDTFAPPNREGTGKVYFTSESLPEAVEYSATEEAKFIASLKRQARVDLVAVDHEVQAIYLLEVKKGGLDDRAVGQLLRYYEHWSKALHRSECRMLNLNYIRPLVVLESLQDSEWRSLPQFFRDVVGIYRYKIDTDGITMSLLNTRRQMMSPF